MQPTYESRTDVPEEFKWDLTPIFESEEEWKISRDEIKSLLDQLDQFRGHVMDSAKNLADALSFMSDQQQRL